MSYMNDWDIHIAYRMYHEHPVLGPAVRTMVTLSEWANRNSDGWTYWPKPSRAASRLQDMIMRDGTAKYRFDEKREDATQAELVKALAPIKAFRTRCIRRGMPDFIIYDAGK